MDPLTTAITNVSLALSAEATTAIATTIQTYERPTTKVNLALGRAAPNTTNVPAVHHLLNVWANNPTITGPQVASALLASANTAQTLRNRQRAALTWTGPHTPTPLRTNREALLEVIEAADHLVTLVSYAGYPIPDITEALQRRLNDGIHLRFILETQTDSGGKLSLDGRAAFNHLTGNITHYTWPKENRPSSPKSLPSMHAKLALADHTALLVTSANLTDNALLHNIEVGVIIRGGPLPEAAADHLDHLIHTQQLAPSP